MARLRTHEGADGAITGLIYLSEHAAVPCERCGAALPPTDKCAHCLHDHRYSSAHWERLEAAKADLAVLAGQTLCSAGVAVDEAYIERWPTQEERERLQQRILFGPPGRTRVFVCQGVDCGGLGGRAALLEIEDLCAELDPTISVQPSVCTLQCANAPVVNVLAAGVERRHYIRVDGTRRCAAVIDDMRGDGDGAPPAGPTTSRLMMMRAEGARWQALRKIGQQRGRDAAANKRLIDGALQAELQVARGDAAMEQRARRRADRLLRAAQALGGR